MKISTPVPARTEEEKESAISNMYSCYKNDTVSHVADSERKFQKTKTFYRNSRLAECVARANVRKINKKLGKQAPKPRKHFSDRRIIGEVCGTVPKNNPFRTAEAV